MGKPGYTYLTTFCLSEVIRIIRDNFFVFLLVGIVTLIAFLNYQPGTWLTGWDNLHPEFNFGLNIKRSIFAVWQEYQGLGLLGGMAYAADLPREIFLWFCNLVLPTSFLRYFYTFLMLLLGPLGVYFLIDFLLCSSHRPRSPLRLRSGQAGHLGRGTLLSFLTTNHLQLTAFLGALFYLFNLATVQIFYVAFEPFVAQYGVLPWLFFSLILYLKKPSKRSLSFFLLANIVSLPQAYVPTVFLVWFTSLVIFLGVLGIFRLCQGFGGQVGKLRGLKKRVFFVFLVVLAVNAFWLLPFLYFTFTNIKAPVDSYINVMSTEDIYLRNKKFGNLANVVALKGFLFDYVEKEFEGQYSYLMGDWRGYVQKAAVNWVIYGFFIIIILGIYHSWRKRKQYFLPFSLLFLFSFTALANNTIPFSLVVEFVRSAIPLAGQIFRVPFTKFANLALFSYSIFFAFGIEEILGFLERLGRFGKKIGLGLVLAALVILVWPIFQGNLFYKKIKIGIPQEYFSLMAYLSQEKNRGRVALLPQPTFWGWGHYSWGYVGSGFLWYGLRNPILERAFDGYSGRNENYYWEISYALYSQNLPLLEKVLEKYQINWLVLDKNIRSHSEYKALYLEKSEELLAKSGKVREIRNFGKIKVYSVSLENKSENFVSLNSNLPQVGPEYKWNNEDTAFEEYGDYISATKKSAEADSGEFNVGKTSAPQATSSVLQDAANVKYQLRSGPEGSRTPELLLEGQSSHYARPTQELAYQELGNSAMEVFYPFHSLFTGRRQEELEFKVEDIHLRQGYGGQEGDYFSFINPIPQELAGQKLNISLEDKDEFVFWDEDLASSSAVPEVWLDKELLFSPPSEESFDSAQDTSEEVRSRDVSLAQSEVFLSLSAFKEGNLEVRVEKKKGYYTYNSADDEEIFAKPVENCDSFNKGVMQRRIIREDGEKLLRFTSLSSSNCLGVDLPRLTHKTGYLIKVESRNIKGKSLLFYVVNKNSEKAEIETYLPSSKLKAQSWQLATGNGQLETSYFIIPPMEEYGQGYSLHFDNISIGRQETINDLVRIEVYPIPYNFLKNLTISSLSSEENLTSSPERLDFQVWHPNPSFYKVILPTTYNLSPTTTLVLSQSYHPGWLAFQIPDSKFQIQKLDNVLVNNWENGFLLNPKSQAPNLKQIQNSNDQNLRNNLAMQPSNNVAVYLFFWPQLLEYFGFGLLFGAGVWIWRIKKIS